MNNRQYTGIEPHSMGMARSFLLPEHFPFDFACASKIPRSEIISVSSGGNVIELAVISPWGNVSVNFVQTGSLSHPDPAFSFFCWAPAPQGPQITVMSDVSDWSDPSGTAAGYTVVVQAARCFRGWLTVAAESVILSVIKAFRRILSAVNALFNRTVFVREGGLRL